MSHVCWDTQHLDILLGVVLFPDNWMNHSTLLYKYNPTYRRQKLAEETETHPFDQHNVSLLTTLSITWTQYTERWKTICSTQEGEETQGGHVLSCHGRG